MGEHKSDLRRRMERHRAFYSRREAGDLLVYINSCYRNVPSLEGALCQLLHECGLAALEPKAVDAVSQDYAGRLREAEGRFYAVGDDSVPCAIVY